MATTPIALATYSGLPDLSADCQLVIDPLREVGFDPVVVDWQTDDVPVGAPVLIRSTWNYYRHQPDFIGWLRRLEDTGHRVLNPSATAQWNADKRYLFDLDERGVNIVPTLLFEPDTSAEALREVMEERAWDVAVAKPTISANAYNTVRFGARDSVVLPDWEGPFLLQPYLSQVATEGEWSFVFFNGEYSHAALKVPANGEWRVQDDYGGSVRAARPSDGVLQQAFDAMMKSEIDDLSYSRLDGVVVNGELFVMELELIEPELFLRCDPDAPARFAKSIRDLIVV